MIRHRLYFIFFVAGILSVLLSAWASFHESVINPDGICYLLSAEAIARSGLHTAMHLCVQSNWPFYAGLINGLVQLTHLSYQSAAFILDGFFTLISVLMFLAIVNELGGSRRTLWFATLVILLAHEFNAVRPYIVRDHGFWAFYLTSVWFLIRYLSDPRWLLAIAWSISLCLATLFRIEGAIFLVALPWIAWFCFRYSLRQRAICFLSLNTVLLAMTAVFSVWMFTHPQATLDQWGRLSELATQAMRGISTITTRLYDTRAGLIEHVIPNEAQRDVNLVFSLTLIMWYVVNVIGNVSVIYALLVLYAWMSRAVLWTRTAALVVVGYLLLNVVVTAAFFAQHLFLSKRYLIALSLILMLWVPFSLDRLLRKSVRQPYRKAYLTAMVLIAFSAVGGIVSFGHSKTYVRDAGDWMATHVPADAKLYANRYQLMYYSQHFGPDIFKTLPLYLDSSSIAGDKWKQYDYIALQLARDERIEKFLPKEILISKPIVFENRHGDRVLIYQVPHEEKHA